MPSALCWCAVILAAWCLAWVVVIYAACRQASLGSGWWRFGGCHARFVLLVRHRLRLLSVGVLRWLLSAVGLRLCLCCLPSRGRCCVGAWPPLMLRPIVLVCGPPHGGACCVGAWPPPWWGVNCRCVHPPMVGRAVLAHGKPHGRACCVVVGPPSWWGVLCWCEARLMVGRAVLVPARHGACVWCGGAGLGLSSVPPGDRHRWVRVGGVIAGAMQSLFCWFGVSLRRLPVGVIGWLCSAVGLRSGLCGLLGRGWCCAGAWPPSWWGWLRWCVAPPMVGRAVLVRASRQLWGVLCRCVAPPMVGRAVLACGLPHGRPCCVVVWPPLWLGVLCWCVNPLMVGRALLLPVRRGGCAWCGGAWFGSLSCVPPGSQRRWVRSGGACGGVLAGAMRGLFCLFGVVFAALRSACSRRCGRRLCCGCGFVDHLAGVGSVLVRGPPHGGACCVGACPPPGWGVLCCCVPPPMVGRAVLVPGPPHGGACCVGAPRPRWWCVVWWF